MAQKPAVEAGTLKHCGKVKGQVPRPERAEKKLMTVQISDYSALCSRTAQSKETSDAKKPGAECMIRVCLYMSLSIYTHIDIVDRDVHVHMYLWVPLKS